MKKVVLAFWLFIGTLATHAQSDNSVQEKTMNYGFNLGINYSNIYHRQTLPNNATLTNSLGFKLGALAEYRVSEFFSISPKSEISFNEGKINFNDKSEYAIMPISVDFMTHLTFRKNNANLKPYVYFGPNVKIPIVTKDMSSNIHSTSTDFAIDLGIGLEKSMDYFNFAPELRYSYGLLNVNQHPALQTLNFHSFSLVLNFLG